MAACSLAGRAILVQHASAGDEVFARGTLLSAQGDECVVRLAAASELTVPAECVHLANPEDAPAPADHCELMHLSEATVLENTRRR